MKNKSKQQRYEPTGKLRLSPYGNKAFKVERQMIDTQTMETSWRDHSYPGNIQQAAATAVHLGIEGFTFESYHDLIRAIEESTKLIVSTMERYDSDVIATCAANA